MRIEFRALNGLVYLKLMIFEPPELPPEFLTGQYEIIDDDPDDKNNGLRGEQG